MNQLVSKKKGIIIAGISATMLIAILGVSFAFWNYSRTTDNQVLVAGDIFMKYTETNQLVIKNALPSKEPGENDYFEFKITGKNTYNKPIWYEIVLNHGVENPEGRTERLLDKFLMFRLVEIKGEEEQIVVDNASYEDITSQKIWVNTIPAGTKDNIEITYKLYMWISFDTKIGNTEGDDYDMETWNNQVYASVKVSVNGDFEEKEIEKGIQYGIGTDVVKDTLGKSGGVIGVTNESEPTNDKDSNIREYRYSGLEVNNYIYFNCEEGTTAENASSKCQLWRIIGVFTDETGEHLKIVDDEASGYPVIWAYDWSTSSDFKDSRLESTLKDDFSYSKSQNMVQETKFYLGQVDIFSGNTIEVYNQERGNTLDFDVKTYTGKVAPLYPSDLGFSTDSSYWNETVMSDLDLSIAKSWFEHMVDEWLLSPSSDEYVVHWISSSLRCDTTSLNGKEYRPCLYLKSDVNITSGDGSKQQPYFLEI